MLRPSSVFEWDEAKNQANIAKHRISFQAAALVFDGQYQEIEDKRRDYGEIRVKVVGKVAYEEVAVICTQRNEVVRIISARRARRDERRDYHQVFSG